MLEKNIEEVIIHQHKLSIFIWNNYLDKENRYVQSTFFINMKERRMIIWLPKLDKKKLGISRDQKYLEVIKYTSKIVDSFIKSSRLL